MPTFAWCPHCELRWNFSPDEDDIESCRHCLEELVALHPDEKSPRTGLWIISGSRQEIKDETEDEVKDEVKEDEIKDEIKEMEIKDEIKEEVKDKIKEEVKDEAKKKCQRRGQGWESRPK
jgi:hypothetical protein